MPVLQQLRLLQWDRLTVPDLIRPGPQSAFRRIEPRPLDRGPQPSFAGPGNHFWKLLYAAGFTPRLFSPEEDAKLLSLGLGITNIVARATRGESDLTWEELQKGGEALRTKSGSISSQSGCSLRAPSISRLRRFVTFRNIRLGSPAKRNGARSTGICCAKSVRPKHHPLHREAAILSTNTQKGADKSQAHDFACQPDCVHRHPPVYSGLPTGSGMLFTCRPRCRVDAFASTY